MRRDHWRVLVVAAVASVASAIAVSRWMRGLSPLRADLVRRRPRGESQGDERLTVVVPAYMEEGRIGTTVRRLQAALDTVAAYGGLEVLVVDDGSSDATAEEAEAAGAVVIRHVENRGKGAAVRSGVLAARGRTIVFTDADLAYAPEQIPGLVELVEEGWDVVVGSRSHDDTTTLVRARRLREIGGRGINLLTRAVLLGQHRDTQCGLKAFRSDVARLIFTHSRLDGFAFDVEVFHLVERYHLSLTEVPVTIENSGRSSVRVVRDALRLVRDLFLVRQWSVEGRYDLTADDLLEAGRGGAVGAGSDGSGLH
jgi:glycosyltransferase involved in cell wall biosynthesis